MKVKVFFFPAPFFMVAM